MPTLYSVADELLTISHNEEMAEEELVERLNDLASAFTDKAEGISKLIRNLESDAAAYDEESKRLAANKKTAQNRIAWLKRYIHDNMTALDLKQLKAGVFKLGVQKNPPRVVIDDEGRLPEQYLEQITETRIDKNAIKDALQQGAVIPGAHLEQGDSLRIR